jgi:hypothetical protein
VEYGVLFEYEAAGRTASARTGGKDENDRIAR